MKFNSICWNIYVCIYGPGAIDTLVKTLIIWSCAHRECEISLMPMPTSQAPTLLGLLFSLFFFFLFKGEAELVLFYHCPQFSVVFSGCHRFICSVQQPVSDPTLLCASLCYNKDISIQFSTLPNIINISSIARLLMSWLWKALLKWLNDNSDLSVHCTRA